MNASRHGPVSAMSRPATQTATNARVSNPRRFRRLRTGWHFGMALQQVPSGSGPVSQGPPQSFERVHFHVPFVSPSLSTSWGLHSVVARHSPFGPGPTRHGQPSQVRPQIQSLFGRS